MGWLLGAISLVAGTLGMIDSIIDDENAKTQLTEEKRLKLAEAQERFDQAKDEAERNADQADLQADMTDKSADITENALSDDFNTAIDNMYLGQAQDTWQWNSASMQMGASRGNALAGLAASGVRAGSSLSDAVLMESATNEAQLQFAQDAKRRSDNNNLASVLNNLAGQSHNIYQNRVGADITRDNAMYLRNSYLEGGHNWNLYENNKAQINLGYDNEIDKHDGWNEALNAASAFFGFGSKALQTGYNTLDTLNKAKDYTVTLGGKK